jgi:uroporphyrinogen decarboxylase
MPNPARDGRMPVNLEAQERLREYWGKNILISSSIAAPFTGLTVLFGVEQVMVMLYDNTRFLKEAMGFLKELAVAWGRVLAGRGADIIWLGDCSASSRFISCEMYYEYVLESARYVAAELKKAGAYVIYHCAENKLENLRAMAEVKPDILTVAHEADIETVKKEACGNVCVMGNLDPVNLIWRGTVEDIKREVEAMTAKAVSTGGHIIGTDEGIPAGTSVDNLHAYIRAIKDSWAQYRERKNV